MEIRTSIRHYVNIGAAVVGIDIAKEFHVAVAQNWDGGRLRHIRFANNRQGYRKLLAYIRKAMKAFGSKVIHVAYEPTGHYWECLVNWLDSKGITCIPIPASHTKKAKELEDNSPEKSDEKDAGVIATLALNGKYIPVVVPRGVFADLRYLCKFRKRLTGEKGRGTNRTHKIMDYLFPELIGIFKGNIGTSLLALLEKAPTPEEVLNFGKIKLTNLLRKKSRGKLGRERAEKTIKAAEASVALKEGNGPLKMELAWVLEDLERLEERIEIVEARIKQALAGVSYARCFLSIRQVGPITAATVLGETGGFDGYRSARQLIKFAGYNLYSKSSGKYRKRDKARKRISKRGSSLMRQILHLAALRLIKKGESFHDFYKHMVEEKHKIKLVAVTAVAVRLLRVLFALYRDHAEFDPENISSRRIELSPAA